MGEELLHITVRNTRVALKLSEAFLELGTFQFLFFKLTLQLLQQMFGRSTQLIVIRQVDLSLTFNCTTNLAANRKFR